MCYINFLEWEFMLFLVFFKVEKATAKRKIDASPRAEREVDRLISSTMPEMTLWEEKAMIRGEGPLRMSESDKETILEGHAHITRMVWLKKERSKREKSGKPSVEKVAVERKVSWEVAELSQLGVVVKFFPPTKPRCIYNNALMHND
jgi:hypothetical protein